MNGFLAIDNVYFNENLTVKNQSFIVVNKI